MMNTRKRKLFFNVTKSERLSPWPHEGEYVGLIEEINAQEEAIEEWMLDMSGITAEKSYKQRFIEDTNMKFICYPYVPSWNPYPTCSYIDVREKENWISLATVIINQKFEFNYKKMTFLIDSSISKSFIGNHVLDSYAHRYGNIYDDMFSLNEWRSDEKNAGEYIGVLPVDLRCRTHFTTFLYDSLFDKVCEKLDIIDR